MPRPIPSLEDSRRAADLLYKDLYSAQAATSLAAAERFRRIAPFRELDAASIVKQRSEVQHKHALQVVAREQGYAAWKNLKDAADVFWCPPGSSAFWHNWCKTYEEARAYREARGGYLLFAHGKCFVAERGYIESLGLDPDDLRWAAIGYDARHPLDQQACEGLVEQLRAVRATRV